MQKEIQCAVCGKSMRRITRTHLIKHNISTDEYKSQFPNSPIVCEELAYALGKASREMSPQRREVVSKQLSAANKGKPKSAEHRAKISERRKGVSWGSHTDEHKEYMRQIMREQYPDRRADLDFTGKKHTDETKQKLGEFRRQWFIDNPGVLTHNKDAKLNLTPEQRANRSLKRCANIAKSIGPFVNTSIERFIASALTERGLHYEQQFMLEDKGGWLYDFFVPEMNLLLEIDGEYFHRISNQQINRDVLKEKIARRQGYRFLRISDNNLDPGLIEMSEEEMMTHNAALIASRGSERGTTP